MHYTSSTERPADIGEGQRVVSAVAGSLLLYFVARKHPGKTLLLLGSSYLLYRAISGHCPITDLIKEGSRTGHAANINVRTHIIVNRPRPEVYAFWRRLENWPLFMQHLESVDELDGRDSRWKLKLPAIGEISWDAEIVKDIKDEELAWHSKPGATIENTGKINFSDTPAKATRIDAMFSYRAPGGVIGERLARLLTPAFRDKIEEDICNFKYYFENAGYAQKT